MGLALGAFIEHRLRHDALRVFIGPMAQHEMSLSIAEVWFGPSLGRHDLASLATRLCVFPTIA